MDIEKDSEDFTIVDALSLAALVNINILKWEIFDGNFFGFFVLRTSTQHHTFNTSTINHVYDNIHPKYNNNY